MTTSTPPRAGVFRGAYKRAATDGTNTIPPSMPGVSTPEPPPTIDALDQAVTSPSSEARQTLLHLGLPGQNMAPFATAVQALSGVWQAPKRERFGWSWGHPAEGSEVAALEIVGKTHRVAFGVRGPSHLVQRIFAQLVASYRQVEPELIDTNAPSGRDPLLLHPGEAASCTELRLDKDAAIPLMTPDPRDFREGADPLRGILEKLAATPEPLLVVSQIVFKAAPAHFEQQTRTRLAALERHKRQTLSARPSGGGNEWGLVCLFLLLALGLLALWMAIEGHFAVFITLLEIGGPLLAVGGLGAAWMAGRRSVQMQ